MVKVKFREVEGTIKNWEWSFPDMPGLTSYLNASRDPLGPSGADPYPDLTLAQKIVEMGGETVEYDEVEFTPGRVY